MSTVLWFILKLVVSFYGLYLLGTWAFVTGAFPEVEGHKTRGDGFWYAVIAGCVVGAYVFLTGWDFQMHGFWYFPAGVGLATSIVVGARNVRLGCNGCPLLDWWIPIVCKLTGSKPMPNNFHWEDKSKINKRWKDE